MLCTWYPGHVNIAIMPSSGSYVLEDQFFHTLGRFYVGFMLARNDGAATVCIASFHTRLKYEESEVTSRTLDRYGLARYRH